MPISRLFYFLLIAFIISQISCWSSKNTSQNKAYLYRTSSPILSLQTKVHHLTKDSSAIYLALKTKQLTVNTTTGNYELVGLFQLYMDEKLTSLSDSSRHQFSMPTTDDNTLIIRQKIKVKQGYNYVLTIYLKDKTTGKYFSEELTIYKSNAFDEQNYLIQLMPKQKLLTTNYVKLGEAVNIKYRNQTNQTYTVNYYTNSRLLALPPFIVSKKTPITHKADSIFQITGTFTPKKAGRYFIQAKINQRTGISLLAVDKAFPKLSSANDLVENLRYITQTKEYKKLVAAKNKKEAVDSFWLARAGSFDRGRVLIKEFYGRVQRANEFFTTYKAGWKTDRGLLFIIYGEPDEVRKGDFGEQWWYETPDNEPSSLRFTFKRMSIPFTHDYHVLQRTPYYEDSWHQAVYEWRKGIIKNKSF